MLCPPAVDLVLVGVKEDNEPVSGAGGWHLHNPITTQAGPALLVAAPGP